MAMAAPILPGTRYIVDEHERVCVEHEKLYYATRAEAVGHLRILRRVRSHEPGLQVFWCQSSAGYHLGH